MSSFPASTDAEWFCRRFEDVVTGVSSGGGSGRSSGRSSLGHVLEDHDTTTQHLSHLLGRVTYGTTNSDPALEHLQRDGPLRPYAWVMGADGLQLFLQSPNHLEALYKIGFERDWIARKLEDHNVFMLGVFPVSDKLQPVPATWDGVFDLVRRAYPDSVSRKVLQHADKLRTVPFEEIERQAMESYLKGATYLTVNETAVNGISRDPRFMDEARFAACEGTLAQARGFLYNKMGLSKFFDGQGFTKNAEGRHFVREYIIPNQKTTAIPHFHYLPLRVPAKLVMEE
jgi:hypothetical protein